MQVTLIDPNISLPIPDLAGGVPLNLQASLSDPLESAHGKTAVISSGISIGIEIADMTLQGQITPLLVGKQAHLGLSIVPETSIVPSSQDTEIFVTIKNINATEYIKILPLETFASLVFTLVTQPVLEINPGT